MPDEIWAAVPGFPNYSISSHGRLRREKTGRLLKVGPGKKGYLKIALRHEGRGQTFRIHSLVAAVFLPPRPSSSHQVAHWDGNNTNNVFTNLRWATQAENEADKVRQGVTRRGAKLTPAQVYSIKERLLEPSAVVAEIARKYRVSPRLISQIRDGQKWRRVVLETQESV